jgi:hypothetical protein
MNLTLYVVAWALLALAVLGLALYRKLATLEEDDLIHLGPGQDKLIPRQVALSGKLDSGPVGESSYDHHFGYRPPACCRISVSGVDFGTVTSPSLPELSWIERAAD